MPYMDDMADMGLIKLHAPSIFTCSSQSRIFGSSAFSSDRKRKRFQESSLGVNGRGGRHREGDYSHHEMWLLFIESRGPMNELFMYVYVYNLW